jgi:predicted O-linked N-acetylglucosamine transferase (SPINDLY family)
MKKIKQTKTRKISDAMDLAISYQQTGHLPEAENIYRKILKEHPNNSQTYVNLGFILRSRGQIDEAATCYKKALALNPYQADVYNDLGSALQAKGQLEEAIIYYLKTLEINPNHATAFYNLGSAYQLKGQLEEAIASYRKAAEYRPSAMLYNNLATALTQKGQIDEAITHYQTALQLNPNYENAYYNLGAALREQGKPEEAIASFDKCLSINPKNTAARWARCMAHLPVIYPDSASIGACRNLYYTELAELAKTIPLKVPREISAAALAVGSQQPFYLAYQGLNDRDIQQLYGSLVCRIMAAAYPQFVPCPTMPLHPSGEPLRVGIISGFFYHHPVWRIIAKGWTENMDKSRIHLYGYYTGRKRDDETESAKRNFSRFVDNVYSFEDLCNTIVNDNLHAIIYPEIGMDSTTVRLAALRLAPVQCVSWGHPDTSGLATIDYYLSSDLMEPSDGDDAYTEQLIRLPNLSIYYTPNEVPDIEIDRESFGLRPESVLYHCCQTLFKFPPDYDEVFPRIARQAGDCQFLFSSLPGSGTSINLFRSRMYKAFDSFHLNADNHIVFMPYLGQAEYKALNSLCDIFLDPIGWSGCTSTLEAVDCNLPIVVLPGSLMRGRESGAILSMMGITETVAKNPDEYVSIAVNLAKDPEWRRQVSEKIAGKKHILYRDQTCVTALEDFIEGVVNAKSGPALK